MYLAGIDPSKAATTAAEFGLGDLGSDKAGRIYQYVQADEAINLTDCVVIAADFGVSQCDVTETTAGTGQGKPVGVAVVAIASASYAWVARNGMFTDFDLNIATSCGAFTELNNTATGGRLDDNDLAGSENIYGLVTVEAEASNAAGFSANWPFVGRSV